MLRLSSSSVVVCFYSDCELHCITVKQRAPARYGEDGGDASAWL